MSKLNINLFRFLPAEIIANILYATNSPLHFYVLYNCLKSCDFITKNNKLRYVNENLIKSIELNSSLKSIKWYIKFLYIVKFFKISNKLNSWYFIFLIAAENNYKDVLKMLLITSKVDPSAKDNYAIYWASKNGYIEVVKLLLEDPRVDPTVDDNFAVKMAIYYGYSEIVQLLMSDPRVLQTYKL